MKSITDRFLALREGIKHYVLTALFAVAAYIGIVAEIFGEHPSERVWTFKLMMAAAIGFAVSFYFSSYLRTQKGDDKFKLPLSLAALAFSIASYFLLDNKSELHIALCVGVVVIFLVLGVYTYFNNENKHLFFTQFLTSIVTAFFMALVFTGGVLIIIAAINFLLFKLDKFGEIMGSVGFLGFEVFFPIALLALLPKPGSLKPSARAVKIIAYNVAFPTFVVLIGVLFIYIAKILVTWQLPSGQINWFVSYAALAYIFFALILPQYETKAVDLFKRFGAWFMIPLIIVQIIMVYIRFDAYGLTPPRWASMITIAIAIAFVLVALFSKTEKVHKAVLAIVVGAFVLAMGPFSLFEMPAWEQNARLARNLKAAGILSESNTLSPQTEVDKDLQKKIFSSWIELDRYRDRGGKVHFEEWLPKREGFEEAFGFKFDESSYWNDPIERTSFYASHSWGLIDVSDASEMFLIGVDERAGGKVKPGKYGIVNIDGESFDIRDELLKLPEADGLYHPEYDDLFKIKLSDKYELYIENATVYLDGDDNNYNDLKGYVLIKE